MELGRLLDQAVADILCELPLTLFSSLDPLVQAALLQLAAKGKVTIDTHKLKLAEIRERNDVLDAALEIVDRKIGQLCRFLDVEGLDEVRIESVDELKEQLVKAYEKRAELIVSVEQKVALVLQILSEVVEKNVLDYQREFNAVRKESLVKSVEMLSLLVRRLSLRLEISFSSSQSQGVSSMITDIDKQIAEKEQVHNRLKSRIEAYRDLASNPRYSEIRRQYSDIQKRIEAFKL